MSLYNLNFYDPIILKDGNLCTDCVVTSYSNGNLSFNITSFTGYSSTDNATLTIWDGSDSEGGSNTYYINQQVPFWANYTLNNGSIVDDGNCTIEFTDYIKNMTFNSTSELYE